jgi:hypothetical protein
MRPRFAIDLRPENRGRGECRAPDAPAASCALLVVSMHTSIHSEPPESPGIPARNGLRLIRALPGDRLSCHRRYADRSANLTPASGRQDHTTSPSASVSFVTDTLASTASRPTFVTIASAPLGDGTAKDILLIWVRRQAIFRKFRIKPRPLARPALVSIHAALGGTTDTTRRAISDAFDPNQISISGGKRYTLRSRWVFNRDRRGPERWSERQLPYGGAWLCGDVLGPNLRYLLADIRWLR